MKRKLYTNAANLPSYVSMTDLLRIYFFMINISIEGPLSALTFHLAVQNIRFKVNVEFVINELIHFGDYNK